jgi:hypothetical protein
MVEIYKTGAHVAGLSERRATQISVAATSSLVQILNERLPTSLQVDAQPNPYGASFVHPCCPS